MKFDLKDGLGVELILIPKGSADII